MARIGRIPFWEWLPGRPWRVVATVEAADEVPSHLPPCGAVIVGSVQRPKWLAFDCPCGTGHRIMVTLDPAHRRHWRISRAKKLTITPSIDYQTDVRRCHFYVIKGRIRWIKNEEGGSYVGYR